MLLALIRTSAVPLAAVLGISLCFGLPQRASAEPGVARISDMQGSVAVQRGDTNTPVAATVNAPVLGADYVTTGNNSRAEIDLDGASQVRLGSDVQMRFSDLDPGNRRMQLAQGPVDLRVFRGNDLGTQIDTPSISIRPHEAGSYRVNVTSDGRTQVDVRSGAVDVITPQGTRTIGPGSTLLAAGSANDPSISTQGAVAADPFDTWNGQRDQYYQAAAPSDPYVSNDVVGVDDLQQYGHWWDDPSYGQVWIPNNEPASWSPYSTGRWVWEDGYGWTWVAAEPWGWAPYHYGSWYRSPQGWAWYPPGPAIVAPVWQPALVAWIGFGGGSGISIGLNLAGPGYDVGWVPLAPFEPYYPWYGNGGPTVINQVTIINNPGAYRNYRYGVMAVSGQQFAAGQFGHPRRYAANQIRNARGFRGAVPIDPTAANLRYSGASVPRNLAVRSNVARMHFAGNAQVAHRTPFTRTHTAMATGIRHARVQTVAAHFTTPTTPAAVHAAAARLASARTTNPHNGGTVTRANTAHTRTNVAHTTTRPNTRTASHANVAHTTNRTTGHTTTTNAWQRFGQKRGTTVGPRTVAHGTTHTATSHTTTAHVNTAHRTTAHVTSAHTTTAHVNTATHATTAHVNTTHRTTTHVTTAHVNTTHRTTAHVAAHTAPAVHARSVPVAHTYTAPRTTTHTAPVTRSYAHTYTAPRTTTHTAPVTRSYARSYTPQRTYTAPARTYTAPVRSAPVMRQAPVRQAPARQAPAARPAQPRDDKHPPR
ncbi:MAG TPA: DUF6600 domain-containing protein [Candidatus Elarobacter sp.]|nr:DUF6600 domain-containing protein [Candidatus Elarobacter sp.]